MLLRLGVPLVLLHAPLHTLLPKVRTPPGWGSPNFTPKQQRRQRLLRTGTLPNSVPRLHPVDSALEGVPSTLFTFRPSTPYSQKAADTGGYGEGAGDATSTATIAVEALQAGLLEETDLDDVSALLVEAFPAGVILADGEFSELESVILGAPLDMTNKYLRAVAYYEVFYALKARIGDRLARGDFALTSEALVLAVRDHAAPANGGGNGGDIIAAVELTLREPNGSVPTNWPFSFPWRRARPAKEWQPYMCNLAVAKGYRGKGYGKQLVRLCEHVAKNHWGYERIYLHVDIDDPVATRLYSSMGYESMEQYDAPLWMRRLFGLPTIRYQVKQFKGRRSVR